MGEKNGRTRAERAYRVVTCPAGPEYEERVVRRTRFKGSRADALLFYERLREDDSSGEEAILVVDGFGCPVYACS